MSYRGLLVCEGTSDAGLVPHLEKLCRESGREVQITCPDPGRLPEPPGHSIASVIAGLLAIDDTFDLLFVHRDADSRDAAPRYREIKEEIERGTQESGIDPGEVPIVPIQATEAWLLLDETLIRYVAGNPDGHMDLDLPRPSGVESIHNPKVVLQAALVTASGLRGRRRRSFTQRFPRNRARLLGLLDTDGVITSLRGWQALVDAVASACAELP